MIKAVRRTSSAAPIRNATIFHSATSTVRFSSFRSDGMVEVKLVGVEVEDTSVSLLLTQVHVQCGEGRRYTQNRVAIVHFLVYFRIVAGGHADTMRLMRGHGTKAISAREQCVQTPTNMN